MFFWADTASFHQISVADIFISDFGVLKACVFANDPSQGKARWKDLRYHTSKTDIMFSFSAWVQANPQAAGSHMRKLGI